MRARAYAPHAHAPHAHTQDEAEGKIDNSDEEGEQEEDGIEQNKDAEEEAEEEEKEHVRDQGEKLKFNSERFTQLSTWQPGTSKLDIVIK